jgi:prolyl oligopeptidase
MKKEIMIVSLALLLVCVAAGCSSQEPPPPEAPQYDAATFFKTASVFGGSFSADESSLLITTDSTGIFNASRQPVAGGDPDQLTTSESNAVFGVSWFPGDDRFLYTADEGGNELNHLFVQEQDGLSKDLTPGENLKASAVGWSGDKKYFWVVTNERDPQNFDLYRYQTDGYKRKLVFENKEGWSVAEVSRDGKWVALGKVRNNADSDIYIWNTKAPSQKPKLVTAHEGDVSHGVMTFTPDSKQLYYTTDEHGEFVQVWSYDLGSGEKEAVVEADWDVAFVYFSENGRYRVTGVNEDAQTSVSILDTEKDLGLTFPNLPAGKITGVSFSPSESKMAFYLNSDTSSSNLYVMDLQSMEAKRLTDTMSPDIDLGFLVESEVIRFKSFDGLEIPSILYRPYAASATNRAPALVWVHGGPGGQSRRGYSAAIQHLVNHGYAVLAVNNRGSSGYGKSFYHMDDKKHGEVDLQDCVWARKHLESLDWVDGSRVGIIGGSYGGYMVAAALAFEPEVFDVGVNIFGVTNWVRTLKSIPPWWAAARDGLYAELGDPAEDEERLRRISPLFHAANIVKPLLVVQGANDPRVLQVESDEIVAAVKENGVPVEYVVFPDEGHGFRNKANRIAASDKYVAFLDKHLKGSAASQ